MMVDAVRLRDLLDRLRDTSANLDRLASLGRAAVRNDTDRLNSAKYLFVLAAEQCIDIGQHIVSSEGLPAPATFADVFAILRDAGWMTADSAERLGELARFRNLLVHGYADVDDDRVVTYLSSDRDDLATFRAQVAQRLAD